MSRPMIEPNMCWRLQGEEYKQPINIKADNKNSTMTFFADESAQILDKPLAYLALPLWLIQM